MDYKIILPVLLSFALSVIMGPVVIPILRKLKMKQTEREDGVKSQVKSIEKLNEESSLSTLWKRI